MAQNFRRYTSNDVGTGAATLFTADSYDTVVGISVANVTASAVVASVYINDGAVSYTHLTLPTKRIV